MGGLFNMCFSLMLLLYSNGDCTSLPSPFICTRGAGLINDWARAWTERRAVSRQEGWFYFQRLCICVFARMCVCVWVGGTEAIFRLKRHWFTFWPERLGRKAGWRMMVGVNRNWGVYAFSAEPCCYLAQNTTESQRCVFASISLGVCSHSPAIYMTVR